MIFKKVKEYTGRQRIEFKKEDCLKKDDKIIIFKDDEYKQYKQEVLDLKNNLIALQSKNEMLMELNANLKSQIDDYKKQNSNLKEIVEDVTAPIKEEVENKDNRIEELETKIDAMEMVCNEFNIDITGLNIFEVIVLRRHKKRAKEFSASINMIVRKKKNIVEADAQSLPGDKQQSNKTTKL